MFKHDHTVLLTTLIRVIVCNYPQFIEMSMWDIRLQRALNAETIKFKKERKLYICFIKDL